MVRKGGYQVTNVEPPPSTFDPENPKDIQDRSFRLCIGSLLAFTVLCLIVIFATLPWGARPSSTEESDLLKGGPHNSTPPPRPPVTPTPPRWSAPQGDPAEPDESALSSTTEDETISTTVDQTSSGPESTSDGSSGGPDSSSTTTEDPSTELPSTSTTAEIGFEMA